MLLELAKFPVKNISFDMRTIYSNGVLKINKEAMLKLISVDNRIESFGVLGDDAQIALGLIRIAQIALAQGLHEALDRGHRRLQLV